MLRAWQVPAGSDRTRVLFEVDSDAQLSVIAGNPGSPAELDLARGAVQELVQADLKDVRIRVLHGLRANVRAAERQVEAAAGTLEQAIACEALRLARCQLVAEQMPDRLSRDVGRHLARNFSGSPKELHMAAEHVLAAPRPGQGRGGDPLLPWVRGGTTSEVA